MKKIIVILLMIVFAISNVACTNPSMIVVPDGSATPVRTAEDTVKASAPWQPTLEEGGLEWGDSEIAVVDITINGWLGELPIYGDTFFSAHVNRVLAGEIPYDTIIIGQSGCSEWLLDGMPLLEQGNRIVGVLIKSEIEDVVFKSQTDGVVPEWYSQTMYYSLYSNSICDVAEVDGEEYILPRDSRFVHQAISSNDITVMKEVSAAAVQKVYENDPLLKDYYKYTRGALNYSEFENTARKYLAAD